MKKLAIITTHPIQYNAPVFKMLAKRKKIDIRVFYTWGDAVLQNKFDPGFGKVIQWDIPLLEGYNHSFPENISNDPGSHHFSGIINPSLVKVINNWNADAVLVFGWSFKSHLQVMKKFHGKIPVFFRGDSTLLDESPAFSAKKLLRRLVLKRIYKKIDRAFYTGLSNKEYFLKHGVKNKQLTFAPHAVDNDRFASGNKTWLRDTLQIPGDELLFLFTGKLEDKKDPMLLLESFADAKLNHAHLVFVGTGALEVKLREAAGVGVAVGENTGRQHLREEAVGDNTARQQGEEDVGNKTGRQRDTVHFLPFQNQSRMPDVYAGADVFVLPSKGPGETWGLSVNEAMAAGLPVIISNRCGCAADLGKLPSVTIFPAGNKPALTQALRAHQGKFVSGDLDKDKTRSFIGPFSFNEICNAIEQCPELQEL